MDYLNYIKKIYSHRYFQVGFFLVLVVVLGYIFQQHWEEIRFDVRVAHGHYVLLMALLVLPNWMLEAKKWHVLVKGVQGYTYMQALKATLAGVSTSLVTPNRIGSIIGRLYYSENLSKKKGAVFMGLSGMTQLLMTLAFGGVSLCYLVLDGKASGISDYLHLSSVAGVLLTLLLVGSLVVFWKYRQKLLNQLKLTKEVWVKLLGLSMLRYVVFSLQFMFCFVGLGLENFGLELFAQVAAVYVLVNCIPGSVFGGLGLREVATLLVFQPAPELLPAYALASLLIWFVNMCLPAGVGIYLLGKEKVFKWKV